MRSDEGSDRRSDLSCTQVRRLLDHLDVGELVDHLAECDACRNYAAAATCD